MLFFLIFCYLPAGWTQESEEAEVLDSSQEENAVLDKASELFGEGKFKATILELSEVESSLKADPNSNQETLGLVYYWKGIAYSRIQDFSLAIENLNQALGLGYEPNDIHYELGQALFASEKLQEAREHFKKSLEGNYKRGVCLYYIGFISRDLGELKKAFTFYRSIQKLPESEAKEVKQAAETQIGDIYLEQVERHPDTFKAVENHVIPQYQLALDIDPNSELASRIQEKIIQLQRKYDLVLFQLRNGRPTLRPPYFLRIGLESGWDSNVTFAPNDTTVAKSKQSSLYGRTAFTGRYTFYYDDMLSFSPELSMGYTRYFNREPEIYRNDNSTFNPSLRTAYEHTLWKKPAALLLDYEFGEIKRDINQEEKLKFNSRSHSLMLGEKFNYFERGESVIRLKQRQTDSYLDNSDSQTTSLIFEQFLGFNLNTVILYVSYDQMRMKDNAFDTNALTARSDILLPSFRGWFNPSVGLGLTRSDPINDFSNRGIEWLINPNVRLSRMFLKNWRANLKIDYQENTSKNEDSFAFKKTLSAIELEYIF